MRGVSVEYRLVNYYKEEGNFAIRLPKSGNNTFDILGFSEGKIDVIECKQRRLEKGERVYFTREELANVIAVAEKIKKILGENVEVKPWLFFASPRRGKSTLYAWIDLSRDFKTLKIFPHPEEEKLVVVRL